MNKTALVTNATHYAGEPAVKALLADGYRVLAQDTAFADHALAEKYAAAFPGILCTAIQEPVALATAASAALGEIRVLISNDAYPAVHMPVEHGDVDALRATLEAVVVYPYRLMQALIPTLKAQDKANIVFITSCRTELPLLGGAIPDAARAAANALVKSLSIELAPFGIAVNAIGPNYLYSEAYFPKAKFVDDPVGKHFIETVVPVGRLGKPEELGELILYLANMQGCFHTGSIIPFAGGWPAAPPRPF
jgi:NAD(P)-dependent dehydrogenase (short-subunit alcohol dehydrogenase family)